MLNELSFLMTIWVCMHKDSLFILLLIVLWTFSQAFLQVIVFLNFMCSNKFYYQTWSHMWVFVFYSHDILVTFECRTFCFVANQLIYSFNQQNYSCQFAEVTLS